MNFLKEHIFFIFKWLYPLAIVTGVGFTLLYSHYDNTLDYYPISLFIIVSISLYTHRIAVKIYEYLLETRKMVDDLLEILNDSSMAE